MDCYGNGKQIIGFLWIPMEMVSKSLDSYGFPMDSHGNGKEIVGFLWIPMAAQPSPSVYYLTPPIS